MRHHIADRIKNYIKMFADEEDAPFCSPVNLNDSYWLENITGEKLNQTDEHIIIQ